MARPPAGRESNWTDLFARVQENDTAVARVNVRLPRGRLPLLGAHPAARSMQDFVHDGVDAPSLLKQMRLPAFVWGRFAPFAWPRLTAPNVMVDELRRRGRG